MSQKEYDIVVLGGGIGGYSAAIRAAQLGKSVAIVEKAKMGGTCLHRGCIPSKALLRSAEVFHDMKNSASFGVRAEAVALDFAAVRQRQESIVQQLYQGLNYLMKKNKIDVFAGYGRVIGPSIFSPRSGSIAVESEEGDNVTLVANHTIIATGSRPRILPGLEPDGIHIFSSDEALQLEKLPDSMLVVGGGAIGVEWASMMNDFGVRVTLIEAEERLLPLEDRDIGKELERLFKKRGIDVLTGTKLHIDQVEKRKDGVQWSAERKGQPVDGLHEAVLVSVGREANTERIGLENTDVIVERGVIQVNRHMQTAESHIYAVGDVIGGYQLAHVAAHEGITAVEHACGVPEKTAVPMNVPRCVYSRPEVACVGQSAAAAEAAGRKIKVGTFPFKALGKAVVLGHNDGFVKVIVDADTDDLIGVHMIGPHATDLISEAGLAALLDATPWEVSKWIFPHPSLSEALGEAMLAVQGKSIGI